MLDSLLEELVHEPNFAAFTTLMPDGKPQTSIMWIDCDHDHLLINTEEQRQKFKNILRDPRVTVVVWDRENPYRYVEARGTVVEIVRGQPAREHIDQVSQKYTGGPYANPIGSPRVLLKIEPARQRRQG
jgi:PPOX class probable F420-dependent enzyme